jgi:hypothetical protein
MDIGKTEDKIHIPPLMSRVYFIVCSIHWPLHHVGEILHDVVVPFSSKKLGVA